MQGIWDLMNKKRHYVPKKGEEMREYSYKSEK